MSNKYQIISILNLINTNNANHSCITAAAGTCIGHDYYKQLFHYKTKTYEKLLQLSKPS